MSRFTLPRRGLLAAAGGGAAWFVSHAGGSRLPLRDGALHALCSHLDCPGSFGQACLQARPAGMASKESLVEAIFSDLPTAARYCASPRVLARLIRERSFEDFRDGRIVTVDGWMLSRIETRLYALAALLANERSSTS